MLKNNAEGKVLGIGYIPGKSATLVRNPNWNAEHRLPARLPERNQHQDRRHRHGDRPPGARRHEHRRRTTRRRRSRSSSSRLKNTRASSQISPGAGSHYIGVNNKVGPFTNVDLRKAFWAALDRAAMDKARGGELVTDVMTHFIYPTIPGFEQAGGLKGPQVDYNEHPEGNMAVAEKYMKLAGYPSGKYTGSQDDRQVVGATRQPGRTGRGNRQPDAEEPRLQDQVHARRSIDRCTRSTATCPKEEIDVCPNVGWIADFADPQTVLNITFNGNLITPDRQRQLGPDEHTRRSTRRWKRPNSVVGKSARATRVGEDRRQNSSKKPPRSRSTGTSRPNIEGKQRRRRRRALEHRRRGTTSYTSLK